MFHITIQNTAGHDGLGGLFHRRLALGLLGDLSFLVPGGPGGGTHADGDVNGRGDPDRVAATVLRKLPHQEGRS